MFTFVTPLSLNNKNKKEMKKIFIFITAVFFGLAVFTGCGNHPDKSKKSDHAKIKTTTSVAYTANIEHGKAIYNKVCIACHMTGVAGAPALKNKARWEEIAKKGMKQLHKDAIDGFTGKHGVMPPKGTCTTCSDQDIYDAVAYMLNKAGVTAKK